MLSLALKSIQWGLFGLSVALISGALGFYALGITTEAETFGIRGANVPGPVIFTALGWLIVRRDRANSVGWFFLANGVLTSLLTFSNAYGIYGLLTRPGLFGAEVAAWYNEWGWIPAMSITMCAIPLSFPDGRPLSRHWLPVYAVWGVSMLVASAALAVRPGLPGMLP